MAARLNSIPEVPLIAIEGIDGCGKGTQVGSVADWFGATSLKYPHYDSVTGRAVLKLLASPGGLDADTFAIALQAVQNANRLENLQLLRDALAAGPVVLDRYMVSGFTYGKADGLDEDLLASILPQELPLANVNILLDISAEESWTRRPKRTDAYESNKAKLELIREYYLGVYKSPPACLRPDVTSWYIVDGTGSKVEVFNRIIASIKASPAYAAYTIGTPA